MDSPRPPLIKHQLKQPRVAELVADGLRERILSGYFQNGNMLPTQAELLADFGVSSPSIREALHILETEGLVTVHRGNVGGSSVHQPQASKAAYMIGLVLESRGVTLADLAHAMFVLEPGCAAHCASRPDRQLLLLPNLRKAIDQGLEVIEDSDAFINAARQFHVTLVAHCGNEVLAVLVGALEDLWSAQIGDLMLDSHNHGSFADLAMRQALSLEHEKIYQLIAEGDAAGAEQAIRDHYKSGTNSGDRQYDLIFDAVISASRFRAHSETERDAADLSA